MSLSNDDNDDMYDVIGGPDDELGEGKFNSYYQDDLEEEGEENPSWNNVAEQDLKPCIACQESAANSKGDMSYPSYGFTPAKTLEYAPTNRSRPPQMLTAAEVMRDNLATRQKLCVVCQEAPAYSKNGKRYPTCGFTCAKVLEQAKTTPTSMISSTGRYQAMATSQLCVVCATKPCRDTRFVTCGMKCAEILVTTGPRDTSMCNYCHRRPKVGGKDQCGATCAQKAKLACLLCKTRPHLGKYPLCSKSCQQLAMKSAPLLLEAPDDHIIFDKVVKKFLSAWKTGTPPATVKKVYKIMENRTFLQPYDAYKKTHGDTEVFRYHGTSRQCTLGTNGNTTLCNISGCALCSILRTSFKVSLADPTGAFGAGVYCSSASNKAYSYTAGGSGALILTKVVLGRAYDVNAFAQVSSCPTGYDSVVFDRQNGTLNETVIYTDDAIRPVYFILF